MTDRILLCLKYGTRYPADYVNVLYNAARAAMRGPFRFVCLTDDARGLVSGIEALPIPDVGLTPAQWYVGGIWPKIGIFDAALHGLRGRCLFVDLDMVILRDLDDFFDVPGPFVGIDGGPNWGRPGTGAAPELCSALIAFDAGALHHIADTFRADPGAVIGRFRTEQAYVEANVPVAFWPGPWVISFKRTLRRPYGVDLLVPPKEPPATAKVLAFHGRPRPIDLLGKGRRFWDVFPHMGHGPVPWLVEYWVRNGGRL